MKPLKISFIALMSACVLFLGVVLCNKKTQSSNVAGRHTFANSYNRLSEKSKIVLNDGQRNYTFSLADGMWRLEEEDSYYADYGVINFLISTLEGSKIYSYEATENDVFEFVPEWKIEIFYDGQLQDSAMIKKNAKGKYLARFNDEKIYQISGYFDFPHTYKLWLKQPLISLETDEIRNISVDGNNIYRERPGGRFFADKEYDEDYLAVAAIELANFDFLKVEKSHEIKKKDAISVVVDMFDGRIYDIEMFQSSGKYYATVKLDTTAAPLIGTQEYVENNRLLYDGWLFEIAAEVYSVFSAMK